MRTIEYIPPFDCFRGSISPRQELQYNTTDGDAWTEQTQHAVPNIYAPIMVCQKRKDTGKRYFMVKSRTSTTWSTTNRLNIAAFGAACALYYALRANNHYWAKIIEIYKSKKRDTPPRGYVVPALREMFATKAEHAQLTAGEDALYIYNEFVHTGTVPYPLPTSIYNKYNQYLSI